MKNDDADAKNASIEINELRRLKKEYEETNEALQKIGEEFGVCAGEPRVDGLRRVLSKMREALEDIANSYTAHGYADAMDAVQALRDTAKDALK